MIFGDLVFCVHFAVLFQSCCTIVAVSGKTSSTPTAATAAASSSTSATSAAGLAAFGRSNASAPNPARKGSTAAKQKYDLPGELGQFCSTLDDCRQYAYMCDTRKQSCECAEGYHPDEVGKSCIGAIGKRCLYDSHCIPNAYCKGQMICTCKREFGYLSPDKWSCQASAAESLHSRKPTKTTTALTTMLLAASAGGVIIIPLLLVSSWQLEINLFTV